MSFWKNAGRAFITKDHTDQPVVHTGRAADILRVVVEALKDAAELTNGAIVVDFGATKATGHVQRNLPALKFPENA